MNQPLNSTFNRTISATTSSSTSTYNESDPAVNSNGASASVSTSTVETASPITRYDELHGVQFDGSKLDAIESSKTTYTADAHPPPKPHSKNFFQKGDPAVEKARRLYLKIYVMGLCMIIATIFAVFSIYWGSLWKVPAHALQGWIVDFDGGTVGQTIVQDVASTSGRLVKWDIVPSSRFPNGAPDVIHALKDNQAWVAVTGECFFDFAIVMDERAHSVNEGATSRLENTVAIPDASYNGSQAITMYGVEARNENAYRVLIRPFVQTSLDTITFEFAKGFASQLSSSPNLPNLLSISPQTVVSPVSYTLVNLIPFAQPVASAVTFVGLIYLLILSFFIVAIGYNARHISGLNNLLRLRSLIFLRLLSSLLGYLFLSLFYSLLSVAFGLDLTRKYGHAGFVLFWMLNWVGMLSVGLAIESLITLLSPAFVPFFMLLWVIVNVSVCVFPIQVLPWIFHYGYAMPFYNISSSVRSITFGTKNTLGLNFGVLIIWIAISFITLPVIQWFVRRREIRAIESTASAPGPVVDEKQEA